MKIAIKQTIKNTLLVLALIGVAIALFALDGARQDSQMRAYAEANNCAWEATGSAYGDNRDFICK